MTVKLPQPEQSPKPKLPERFEQFHRRNPSVLDTLIRLAREAKATGLTHLSIKYIYEIARMDPSLVTDGRPFKLTNSYTAFYARKIVDEAPDLASLFTLRPQRWHTRIVGERAWVGEQESTLN
jgi:hypothetical protein